MLRRGELHLSAISVLRSALTVDNHAEVLSRAKYISKRDCERLLAELRPRPTSADSIRRLPKVPSEAAPVENDVQAKSEALSVDIGGGETCSPAARTHNLVMPLSSESFKVSFCCGESMRRKLDDAKNLLGVHGDKGLAEIIVASYRSAILKDSAQGLAPRFLTM